MYVPSRWKNRDCNYANLLIKAITMTLDNDRYENMAYRRCGRSGLMLPAISLGGWHNFSDRDQAVMLMTAAFDLGITHFDLANN